MKKKQTKFRLFLTVAFLLSMVLGVIFFYSGDQKLITFEKISAKISGKNFEIELAISDQQRAHGLMHREKLADNQAMLFVFPKKDRHGFWMKNTRIPLKIIWISDDGKAQEIARAEPCHTEYCPSFIPKNSVKYVLEVEKNNLEDVRIGDIVLDKNLLNLLN